MAFKYAIKGIYKFFKSESHAKIHLVAASSVILLAFYFKVKLYEFYILLICIALVIISEMINSAIESIANAVTEKPNLWIENAKDIAAGAVLIASICSAIIGCFIFSSYIYNLFE